MDAIDELLGVADDDEAGALDEFAGGGNPRGGGPTAVDVELKKTLPIGFVKNIAGSGTGDVTITPQRAFKARRLVIAAGVAADFEITDIKIGTESQLVAIGNLDARAFTEVSTGDNMNLPVCPLGRDITISVKNLNASAKDFKGVLFGWVGKK